eukprot:482495_1
MGNANTLMANKRDKIEQKEIVNDKKWIALKDEKGKTLFDEVKKENMYIQPHLISSHILQQGSCTCGIVSILMIFNAKIKALKYDAIKEMKESKFLKHAILNKSIDVNAVKNNGIVLDDVGKALSDYGCDVSVHHTSDKDINVDVFRNKCCEVFSNKQSDKAIIVNYLMKAMDQMFNVGHHSPIAAYNKKTDCVLLLDTWPHDEVCWVKINDLYNAMKTVDKDCNKYRGFVVVNKVNVELLSQGLTIKNNAQR